MDPDQMTLTIVNEFKRRTQDKVERREPITQSTVESVVADIKQEMDPYRNDISQWRRQLPSETRNCPDRILHESMAYGDDPQRARSALQAKLGGTGASDDSIDASLDSIIEPLTSLRDEMALNPLTNLFRAVHDVDDQDTGRVSRLFLSEALHCAPGLQGYTFTSAQNAVKAIRETNYESDNPDNLLAILKTCDAYDDVRGYMEKQRPKSDMRQNEPARATTSSFNTDFNANHRNNSVNDTLPSSYKPLQRSSQSSWQSSGPPVQPLSNTRNDDQNSDSTRYNFN